MTTGRGSDVGDHHVRGLSESGYPGRHGSQGRAFPEARKPALKLLIDFGPAIGQKKSSAQITRHYDPADLVGRQVCAVVNFKPRQIGPFMSEVLTLGFPDQEGEVVLTGPTRSVPDGGRLF